jgi:hypothetical protein
MIDEDLAHQRARQRKEVGPVLQRHAVDIDESQVDLMNERRRLQCVSRRFTPEMAARDAAKLLIHDREQAVERRGVSLAPGQQQVRYIRHAEPSMIGS